MLIPDVNVLLGAHRRDDPTHRQLNGWLAAHLVGAEPIGVADIVLSAVVRIATNRRVYREPATPDEALAFCEAIRRSPAATRIVPGPRHWEVFAALVRDTAARGNAVPDAYLAAFAIETSATFVTRDREVRRLPGLTVRDPLAGPRP